MFGIAGTAELSTFCPGTGTWNRLQDGTVDRPVADMSHAGSSKLLTKCMMLTLSGKVAICYVELVFTSALCC